MAQKHLLYLPIALLFLLLLAQDSDAALFGRFFGTQDTYDCEPAADSQRPGTEERAESKEDKEEGLFWYDSYAKAYDQAKSARKMLLVNFVPQQADRNQQELQRAIDWRQDWQQKLQRFVLCRIPADAEITVNGRPVRLLSHAAFGEMHGRPGIAVLDLAHTRQPYYGHVVSAFPFMYSKYYRWHTNHLATVLDLPPGTITQRTMIWAVRTHPERPASTNGVHDPTLASAAGSHSHHQAMIGTQGHHNWEGRFHRLRRLLGGGMPVEVVAESWPGQTMIDSCVDCVDSWRQSSGHWSAVRNWQSRFGFDIRRGRNGIWYGTGILVR